MINPQFQATWTPQETTLPEGFFLSNPPSSLSIVTYPAVIEVDGHSLGFHIQLPGPKTDCGWESIKEIAGMGTCRASLPSHIKSYCLTIFHIFHSKILNNMGVSYVSFKFEIIWNNQHPRPQTIQFQSPKRRPSFCWKRRSRPWRPTAWNAQWRSPRLARWDEIMQKDEKKTVMMMMMKMNDDVSDGETETYYQTYVTRNVHHNESLQPSCIMQW